MSDGIFIGLGAPEKDGGVPQHLNLRRANRHGLIVKAFLLLGLPGDLVTLVAEWQRGAGP